MGIYFEIFELLPVILPKVITAALCGLIIGLDREFKQKAAGIRTFILISVGCCIFTSVSFLLADMGNSIDPTRIIAQIITGIGFLGAGAIFKAEDRVVGITTASFIWSISAIGILAGVGMVIVPLTLTIGLLLTSLFFEKIENYIKKKNEKSDNKDK